VNISPDLPQESISTSYSLGKSKGCDDILGRESSQVATIYQPVVDTYQNPTDKQSKTIVENPPNIILDGPITTNYPVNVDLLDVETIPHPTTTPPPIIITNSTIIPTNNFNHPLLPNMTENQFIVGSAPPVRRDAISLLGEKKRLHFRCGHVGYQR
jgi:hypothetical protein